METKYFKDIKSEVKSMKTKIVALSTLFGNDHLLVGDNDEEIFQNIANDQGFGRIYINEDLEVGVEQSGACHHCQGLGYTTHYDIDGERETRCDQCVDGAWTEVWTLERISKILQEERIYRRNWEAAAEDY